ncbi:hypothetical protein D3C81_963850 [compost metagenome]
MFWRNVAKQRVGPANQRFGAHQALGFQAEFGLVAQAQLVALYGPAQFVFQGNALAGLGREVAGVAFDPVAAFGLGAVHRRVGIADQRGDIGAVLRVQAGADARAGEELVFAGLERRAEAGQQFVGDMTGVAGLVQTGQQDDELITAQARHCIDIAHLFFQALGDAFEQQVADRMAKAVVDVLETVEVEKQHGPLTF